MWHHCPSIKCNITGLLSLHLPPQPPLSPELIRTRLRFALRFERRIGKMLWMSSGDQVKAKREERRKACHGYQTLGSARCVAEWGPGQRSDRPSVCLKASPFCSGSHPSPWPEVTTPEAKGEGKREDTVSVFFFFFFFFVAAFLKFKICYRLRKLYTLNVWIESWGLSPLNREYSCNVTHWSVIW